MGASNSERANGQAAAAEHAAAEDASGKPVDVDGLLAKVAPHAAAEAQAAAASSALGGVGLRTGTAVAIQGREVTVTCRGIAGELRVELAPEVSRQLVEQAVAAGGTVLLEMTPNAPALLVGVLQTQLPDALTIHARRIELEADEELLLRSGKGALRIRQDGELELVGSRISALSRGLFRLVGRILRLN